jgi:uncharacterized SAM-binding protein YcdF (DUF218 family)
VKRRAVLHRRLLAFVAALGLVMAALTARLFVWPHADEPVRADAVVVLAGEGGRYARAVELMRRGVAPTLLVSSARDEKTGTWESPACGRRRPYEVVCFEPSPVRTIGEARAVARIAHRRGYDHIVVVTARYHLTRARMLFERCIDGDVDMVRSGGAIRPRTLVHEWGGVIYALVRRGC